MTPDQFEHWLDFATRMARACHRRNPRVEESVRDFIENQRGYEAHIHGWDGDSCDECRADRATRPIYLCDEVSEFLWNRRMERERSDGEIYWTRTGAAVSCCIRAAIDVAVKQSCGVLGYTVGDLRAMYPDGFPAWLSKDYTGNRRTKDAAQVWL